MLKICGEKRRWKRIILQSERMNSQGLVVELSDSVEHLFEICGHNLKWV